MTSEEFVVKHADWLVPLVLLLLQFLMKYLIAQRLSGGRLWEAVLQTPVDIGFLALSFAATVLLRDPSHAPFMFWVALVYVILLMVCVAIANVSPKQLVRRDVLIAFGLAILNFALSLGMLAHSVRLLVPPGAPNGN
jgi:hypothetical protein